MQGRTFLPATVTYITRWEWLLGLLVVGSEWFASTAEACSTRITVDTCLAEELKYRQFISALAKY
jgi:hypothetical protein